MAGTLRPATVGGPPDAATVRDLLVSHVDAAITRIERGRAMTDLDVHETRKSIKRARAILKLLRPALTARSYARSKQELRNAGRVLAAVRDARVIADRFDEMLRRTGARGSSISDLTATLHVAAAMPRRAGATKPRDAAIALAGLTAARKRLARVSLPARSRSALASGFRSIYRSGREAMPRRAEVVSAAVMHEFRKRVKDYWHALEVFAPLQWPQIGRALRSARQLADLLGEYHDLALLADKVRTITTNPDDPIRSVLDALEARQRRLRRKALGIGATLYAEPPAAMAKRLGHALQTA